MNTTYFFKELFEGLVRVFYPALCDNCHNVLLKGESTLCIECLHLLPIYTQVEDQNTPSAQRLSGRFPFHHAYAFTSFESKGMMQKLLHEFKYHHRLDIGKFLANEMALRISTSQWIKNIDAIVPVPLHKTKKQERGFNQSEIISKELSNTFQWKLLTEGLTRIRKTESQTKKRREERWTNMTDAFIAHTEHFDGIKSIVLLDDVLTTGATITSCACAILKAVDVEINVLTLAIAEN